MLRAEPRYGFTIAVVILDLIDTVDIDLENPLAVLASTILVVAFEQQPWIRFAGRLTWREAETAAVDERLRTPMTRLEWLTVEAARIVAGLHGGMETTWTSSGVSAGEPNASGSRSSKTGVFDSA